MGVAEAPRAKGRNAMKSRSRILGMLLVSTLLVPAAAQSTTIVHFALADPGVTVGASTTLEIRADFDTPVLGFGIDLVLDPSVLAVAGPPLVGPAWTPVFAPDGDGLAGLAPASGVVGPGVLLATVVVTRVDPAATSIDGTVTPGDLTEGFPLVGSGFDAVGFVPLPVVAVPEAGVAPLLAMAWVASLSGRRRGSAAYSSTRSTNRSTSAPPTQEPIGMSR
jgi:hypothetical protein